ncbi:lanthionine synthetase LanC family protein [Macellibacteroides fermentans]|uniref:Lantibiotic modifying enzyme n=1 Tax=Macellibacteroides fermentans TaxID=879969 RepID=A0A8E2A1V1_9PORP|nr:lanthionine synthetase LanC family protein [Macellibacteroides fermentans]NYI50020.1 lantibiotic modifying enzyme [Macellibacteroides fermentans]
MNWIPIINKELHDQVDGKINEIFSALTQHEADFKVPDLFTGESGICLFLAYYSQLSNNSDLDLTTYIDNIVDMTDEIFSTPLNDYKDITIISELGWMIQHLSLHNMIDIDSEDYFRDLDESLYESLFLFINNNRYDCLNGVINIGIYFYNRYLYGNNEKCYTYLEEMVEQMAAKRIEEDGLVKWMSIVDYKNHRLGYNLGIAHGIPGLILFFIKLYDINIKKDLLSRLIIKSSLYLLSHKRVLGKFKSYFPGIYSDIEESDKTKLSLNNNHETRLGWCYGDLSVGYALYKASLLGFDEIMFLEEESLDILIQTTYRKSLIDMGIKDACLCHGTAGISHIYNRLYHLSGNDEFKNAASFWLCETLGMAKEENIFAGYVTDLYNNEEKKIEILKNRSFLSGISGIGLFFLSVLHPSEPYWDECMLLS